MVLIITIIIIVVLPLIKIPTSEIQQDVARKTVFATVVCSLTCCGFFKMPCVL